MVWSGLAPDNFKELVRLILDLTLVSTSFYVLLALIRERRAQWMLRGLLILIVSLFISDRLLHLTILSFLLEKLVLVCALSMAIVFQSDFRNFLEQLGKGQFKQLWESHSNIPKGDTVIDEIVEAVKDLSQNRTGALIVIETFNTVEETVFVNQGVRLNAEVSKELLQTIFQTSTLLHDGSVFIRGSEIVSAGVILPLSDRNTSRQLGTRHRAAMGVTEIVGNCLCVVVSEETGSISLAEKGNLNRPLTSIKLKELLEEKLSIPQEREVVTGVTRLSKKLGFQGWNLLRRFLQLDDTQSHSSSYSKLPSSSSRKNLSK
jgi:uncharacterized protein (TIGR00159 family)